MEFTVVAERDGATTDRATAYGRDAAKLAALTLIEDGNEKAAIYNPSGALVAGADRRGFWTLHLRESF